jgi:hypothetical protein
VTTRTAWLLAALNLFALIAALWVYQSVIRPPNTDGAAFEQRITSRLASIKTPSEMQAAAADLGRLAGSFTTVTQSAADVSRGALEPILILGAGNICVIIAGAIDLRRQKRSTQKVA